MGMPGLLPDETVTVGRENLDADHAARHDDKDDARACEEVGPREEFGLGAKFRSTSRPARWLPVGTEVTAMLTGGR